jgi:hypothetical protein
MAKLSKRTVDAAETRSSDYFIWDDELPGFGLRIFQSGKRSYLVQYRAAGRTRRSVFTAPGLPKRHAERPASFSGGLPRVRTRHKSVCSTPKP